MGYKLDHYIERECYTYDDYMGKEIYMEEIHLTGNGITDTISIRQGDMCITMTNTHKLLNFVNYLRGFLNEYRTA